MGVKKIYVHTSIAVLIFAAIMIFLPVRNGLTDLGVPAIAIFTSTIYLWLTVEQVWPSLLAMGLIAMFGIVSPADIFSSGFGNESAIFIVICTLFAESLRKTGVIENLAYALLSSKIYKGKPYAFIALYLGSALMLGFFLPQFPLLMIYVNFANEIAEQLGYKKSHRFTATLILGLAILLTLAGAATPFSHSRVLIMMNWIAELGYSVTALSYSLVGITYSICIYVIVMLCFILFNKKEDFSDFNRYYEIAKNKPKQHISFSLEGKISLVAFVIALICWTGGDIFSGIEPQVASFMSKIGMTIPCMILMALLNLIHIKRKPVFSCKESLRNAPWEAYIFTAGMLVVSGLVSNPDTGISAWLFTTLRPLIEGVDARVIVAISIVLAILITQIATNIITANVIWLIASPLLLSMNVVNGNNNLVVFGILVILVSNISWMSPSASIGMPLMFSAGYFDDKQYFFKNSITILIAILLFSLFIFYPLASKIVPAVI